MVPRFDVYVLLFTISAVDLWRDFSGIQNVCQPPVSQSSACCLARVAVTGPGLYFVRGLFGGFIRLLLHH